jgi:hypothetical protein
MTACDSLPWFDSTLRYGGFVHRLAFEHALIATVADTDLPIHLIAVEKQAPHRCGVWFVSGRLVQKTRKENDKAIDQFKRCREQDYWPTGYEQIRTLSPIGI